MQQFTNVLDLAAEFDCSRDDINNALKRFVAPELVPPAAVGQTRTMRREQAVLVGFAIAARAAGFSPEVIQTLTRDYCVQLEKPDGAFAILNDRGGCEVLRKRSLENIASADLLGPWAQAGYLWVRVINLEVINKKVDAAVKRTTARFDVAPATVGGWR
jgi:uncharacterized protein YdhG (YjbR/CyaY superfamily)